MDEIVKAALRKWPNVPHCHGWLGLDMRGDWYLRDEPTQAAGPFPHPRGSRLVHDKLREFIARNYAVDEQGCWFFQNGPQRVYVELEAAPWVWRLHESLEPAASPRLVSHTGREASFEAAWVDEAGRLFLATGLGLGIVHPQDMHLAASAVEAGIWRVQEVRFEELPQRYRYCLSPQAVKRSPSRA